MRPRLALIVLALLLSGCATDPEGVPSNMPELKQAMGFADPPAVYEPPLAKATANATSVLVGWPVRYTAEGSKDPQGLPIAYLWSFGDGAFGAGESVTHAYSKAGEYLVRLTITSDKGLADHAVVTVQVAAGNRAPLAALRILDATGSEVTGAERGASLVFDASSSIDPDGGGLKVDLDLGDGTTSHDARVTHAYAAPGRYTVRLQVGDPAGLSATTTRVVTVNATFEKTGKLSLTGESKDALVFPVGAGVSRLVATLKFDAALGANDLTLVLKAPGDREVAVAKSPTAPGTQGVLTRTLELDAQALASELTGDWTVEVRRESTSPAGVEFTVVVRETY